MLALSDNRIRGSRLGAISYETDRQLNPPPRQIARYRTADGKEYEVPFADDADVPNTWSCRNGMEGKLIGGDDQQPKKTKRVRTHWDMVLERRSIEDLEVLFKERLALITNQRRGP